MPHTFAELPSVTARSAMRQERTCPPGLEADFRQSRSLTPLPPHCGRSPPSLVSTGGKHRRPDAGGESAAVFRAAHDPNNSRGLFVRRGGELCQARRSALGQL